MSKEQYGMILWGPCNVRVRIQMRTHIGMNCPRPKTRREHIGSGKFCNGYMVQTLTHGFEVDSAHDISTPCSKEVSL